MQLFRTTCRLPARQQDLLRNHHRPPLGLLRRRRALWQLHRTQLQLASFCPFHVPRIISIKLSTKPCDFAARKRQSGGRILPHPQVLCGTRMSFGLEKAAQYAAWRENGCLTSCARAASGHATVLPTSVMNSRRLIDRSAIRSEPWSGLQDIGLAEISQPIDRLFPEASQEPILRWFFALFADKRRVWPPEPIPQARTTPSARRSSASSVH